MGKYHDFDSAWAAHTKEPIKVTIMGKAYTVSQELPASLMLRLMRMQNTQEVKAEDLEPGGAIAAIIDAIFGKNTMKSWLDNNITFIQLTDIMQYISSGFQDHITRETPDGESVPLTLSSTGRPAKQTSGGNTESGS